MPVAKFYVWGSEPNNDSVREFLDRASDVYANVLECPKERVRVIFIPCSRDMVAVEGNVPGAASVFFEFIVLQGRSLTQRQQIAKGFCGLIEDVLGLDLQRVRGRCIPVAPEDWCIGGEFADSLRKTEIESRKNQLKR
ncbi:tautomerase family protein [Marinobacter sp.]|uniref:tautomerase family protein n=1 Tax=Marinobacter sp. TaxID=50741 RepID=UPI000C408E3D|nr:4-oxalocrotonate tautomerase [Marinobacter sp.]MAO12128.1 4-oxalocrotonate tautomerase [Marinobacter sp.]|tara:strand:+ start:4068 stop:4481 length:414 start_codon:yes stop_codon:yes gene_type:complete